MFSCYHGHVVLSAHSGVLHALQGRQDALFNPTTSDVIQKRHPYTENLTSETSGHSKIEFLHCGYVLAQHIW